MDMSWGVLLQVIIISIQIFKTCAIKCDLSGDCGVSGGQTRLVCSEASPTPIDPILSAWTGPGNIALVLAGNPVNSSTHSFEKEIDKFYLVITNTDEDSLGSYYCSDEFNTSPMCDIVRDNIQAMTCSHEDTGTGNQFGISMNYRPYDVNPAITVKAPDGTAVSGSFVDSGTVSGLVKQIQWKSTSSNLLGGTYTYTVKKTGNCDLVNDCTGSIEVQAAPTTGSPPLPDGAIAGIIVGSLLFIGLVIGGGLVLYKKKIICAQQESTQKNAVSDKVFPNDKPETEVGLP